MVDPNYHELAEVVQTVMKAFKAVEANSEK